MKNALIIIVDIGALTFATACSQAYNKSGGSPDADTYPTNIELSKAPDVYLPNPLED